MQPHFLKINSQFPEYVEQFCNNGNNLVHFECQKWMINQS